MDPVVRRPIDVPQQEALLLEAFQLSLELIARQGVTAQGEVARLQIILHGQPANFPQNARPDGNFLFRPPNCQLSQLVHQDIFSLTVRRNKAVRIPPALDQLLLLGEKREGGDELEMCEQHTVRWCEANAS